MQHDPSLRPPVRAGRGPRPAARASLAAVLLAALVVAGGVSAPAQADTVSAPTLRVMAGDSALTASWSGVPDATGYTVKVSEKPSLAHARVVHTTERLALVKHLLNGHTYFVAVTAERPMLVGSAVRSSIVHVTAHRGVPLPVGPVHAAPGAQPNQITVSWTGGDKALKVGIVAGSDINTTQHMFHSAWYPATTHSITITVPEAFRAMIGAGTGTPVFVKVAQSNSGSTTFHSTYYYDDKYRTSHVGTWGLAATAPATGNVTKLRVAELNTQTNGATDHFTSSNQWPARLPRVAKNVNSADADLFLTAELSTNADASGKVACHNTLKSPYLCASLTQYLQLARRLPGLTLADGDSYDRVLDAMRNLGAPFDGAITDGAHIFYNRSKLTLLDHGYLSPALTPAQSFSNVTGLGVAGWMHVKGISGDRWLTWAKFRTTDSAQRVFYAVSAHLPVGTSAPIVAARAEAAQRAEAVISQMAGNLPVIFGGDFNSDPTRNPNPAQAVFMKRGWFDAAAVPNVSMRKNEQYSTTNNGGPQTGRDQGYPLKPYKQKWPTSRIDYILLKNSPHTYSYDNVLHLNPDGTFDHSYQGTDHNMQVAVVGIGDPVTTP